jgi:putative membrane protein (TIGR04086 family)
VVLLLAYLFGGYVAGRMARRAGLLNGLAVFLLAIVLIAAVGALVANQADADTIRTNLRSLGIPTSGTEWSDSVPWPASPRWPPCWSARWSAS